MSNNQPIVSVIIPTRNRCLRLIRALGSVHDQTWKNLEIIIVDDASVDETPNKLERLLEQGRVHKVIRHTSAKGGGAARNSGIEVATGDYIAFLDDDDIWVKDKIEAQVTLLNNNQSSPAVSCGFFIETRLLGVKNYLLKPMNDLQQLLRANRLGGASMCLARVEALRKIGGFDPKLRSGQDWDLWIRLAALGEILVCPKALVQYVAHHEERITTNIFNAYRGRRRVFLLHKSKMKRDTRLFVLCELAYYRKVLMVDRLNKKLSGLIFVIKQSSFAVSLRYLYRFSKSLLQSFV